jgi:hypothetical protein
MRVAGWAAAAMVTGTVFARQPSEENRQETQTLLVVERGTCADLFVAEKDAALMRALEMLPARLRELPGQARELRNVPPEALELLIDVFRHPARMAITNKGFDQQTGMPGIGVVVSFKADEKGEADARAMHERFDLVRTMAQAPFEPSASKRFPGMTDLPLPLGVLSYGPRKAADGWRFELLFAAVDDPDAAFKGLPEMAAGVTPVVRGSVDFAAWSPLVQMFAGFAAMASPQGRHFLEQLKSSGLVGPDAIRVDVTLGHSADAMKRVYAMRRLGRHLETMAYTKATVTAEDLTVVPGDASFVSVAKLDARRAWAVFRRQLEAVNPDEFREGLEKVKREWGFDPEADLIHALGETVSAYFADSTGGGSLLSGVVLVGLSDPAKVSNTLGTIASRANRALAEEDDPPGRAEIARFERDGASYVQLRVPGLPVPIEPTLAVVGRWLVIGVTPQAATAGAWHVMQAKVGGGILSSKAFASTGWDRAGGVTMVSYTDSSRTVRDGFATASLIGSAVANLVRSSIAAPAAREPGLVLPVYTDLAKDARPSVAVSYWNGEDLITEYTSDRSVLVALASTLGIGDVAPFIGGMIMGGAIGAGAAEGMGGRRHEAPEWQGMEDAEEEEAMPEEAAEEAPAEGGKTPY